MAVEPERHGTVTRTRRRLLIVIAAVVAVLTLAAGAAAWWRWDTGRQPRIEDVAAELDTAVVDAVVAAGQDAAVAVSPVVRSADCRLGPFRQGGIFTAAADLYTEPGAEDALITGIEERLPQRYTVTRGTAVAGVRPLQAHAGTAVTLAVRRLSPGWLTVLARSTCSLGAVAVPGAPAATSAGVTALTGLLQRLGTRPTGITEHRLPCATGHIVTIAGTSEQTQTADLNQRLDDVIPGGAHRFDPGESNRIAYRDGAVSVIVAASDDGTAVSAQYTTMC